MTGSVVIPAGTMVIPADNLPENSTIKYWALPWNGMDEVAESHERNYGFGLEAGDVTE
jgi:hypothetical protein